MLQGELFESHLQCHLPQQMNNKAMVCLVLTLQAGLTPLHYAAWQGSVDAVQILLDAGADVNVRDPVSNPDIAVRCGECVAPCLHNNSAFIMLA